MSQSTALQWAESGRLPDWLIRTGIRRLLRRRLSEEATIPDADRTTWLSDLATGPIAVHTELANEQHYEVVPAFFEAILGPHLKYSSGYWSPGATSLPEAEAAMLQLSCERAQIQDGQTILDLGCGWGSLSLWIAEHFPACSVLAISNSKLQREFIESRCAQREISNLRVVTADINHFDPAARFDRVVSVEMFEHMRNWSLLLERIDDWLEPSGKLFVHIFCHREYSYPYEDRASGDWMARHFFSGGIMPAFDLLPTISDRFQLEESWRIDGRHYQKTLEAWLQKLDAAPNLEIPLTQVYGADAKLWRQRWRIFLMSCSELFGYRDGQEWNVAHYRMSR